MSLGINAVSNMLGKGQQVLASLDAGYYTQYYNILNCYCLLCKVDMSMDIRGVSVLLMPISIDCKNDP